MGEGVHVFDVAVRVLNTATGDDKVKQTLDAYEALKRGELELPDVDAPSHVGASASRQGHRARPDVLPPDVPARDPNLEYVEPLLIPKRGKCGTAQSRIAHLHALVHIEACAVDLAWDIIARFGQHEEYRDVLPADFYRDFVIVAADEARHYAALKARLEELGGKYGDIVVHDGLWDSARRTKDRLEARLAVEHATHEARGLDVLPATISKFEKSGDAQTAALLSEVILPEEISHCAAGIKWIKYLYALGGNAAYQGRTWAKDACEYDKVECWFHALVRGHYYGFLKPPFNKAAREEAGFSEEWYIPLMDAADG